MSTGRIRLAGAWAALACWAWGADFYVATNGCDAYPGTLEQPLASLAGARDAVRAWRAQPGSSGPARVLVGDGTYALTSPLTLGLEDGGTSDGPVLYCAEPGAHPVFSGGRRIRGWSRGAGGVWKAYLPSVSSGAEYFEQLFVDGRRARRARSPNADYFYAAGAVPAASNRAFVASAADVAPLSALAGKAFADANVVVYHTWETSRHRPVSLGADHVLTVTNRAPWAIAAGQRYQLENIEAALDEPGEWFLSRNGTLSYWPLAGEDMNTAEVVAPAASRFIDVAGDPATGRFVQHVTFQGLAFRYSHYALPPDGHAVNQAEADLPAAITVNGGRFVSFIDCAIEHVGAHALRFQRGCRSGLASRCYLSDLGGGGVYIGETTQRAADSDRTGAVAVDNCIIRAGGRLHAGAIGVWIGQSFDNQVTRNDISDFYYTGVSVGWTWGYGASLAARNRIDGNSLHHLGWGVLSDMGAVYTLGVSPGTTVNGNVAHHITSYGYGGWGLYNDEGSSGILLASNLVYDTKSGGYHQHYGETNVVRNNIFAHGITAQLQRSRKETNHVSFVFANNIVYWPLGTLLYSQWSDTDFFVMRSNLYWQASGQEITFAGNTFSQWQALGQDAGSRIANPQFADGLNRDFRFASTEAAESVGFQPFAFAAAGVTGAAWRARALVPSAPDSLPQPVSYAPFDYCEDFEGLAAGALPRNAGVYGVTGGAAVGVVTNLAASGAKCLALTDAPGLSQTFFPYVTYSPPDLAGALNYAFDIRLAPDTRMYHEWRDYTAGAYLAGPSLWLDKGQLKVNGAALASVPSNTWLHIDVVCDTAAYAGQGWSLGLTLPGQATQWFTHLHSGSTNWCRLDWLGWVSENTNATTFHLDNLSTTNLAAFLQPPAPPEPLIAGLADLAIPAGASTGPLAFTVSAAAPEAALAVSASASNARLVPDSGLCLGGAGANRTLTVTPAPGESGVADIRVTADDGVFHATASFRLTVEPAAGAALRAVGLTAPFGNVTNAASVLVAAAADDPGGVLQRIDYYADGGLLGSVAAWPFAAAWTNLAYGPHTLVAAAWDAAGRSVTSPPLAFTNYLPPLAAELVPAGAAWRYFDRTNDLGTAWRGAAYDDAAWSNGPAMLGYGDANGQPPATAIASNGRWTTYFRRPFVVASPETIGALTARMQRDDGAVVYLNGAEVWRDNMPAGALSNASPASSSIGGAAESAWLTNAVSPARLVAGTNQLAVEVHQSSLTSSDCAFDFALDAAAVLPDRPELGVAAAGAGFALSWPALDPGAFRVYAATSLAPPVAWAPLTLVPVLNGASWSVPAPPAASREHFFRLQAR